MLVASAAPMAMHELPAVPLAFQHDDGLLGPRILHDRDHRDLLHRGRCRRFGPLPGRRGVSERDDDQDDHPSSTVASHGFPSLPLRMPPV